MCKCFETLFVELGMVIRQMLPCQAPGLSEWPFSMQPGLKYVSVSPYHNTSVCQSIDFTY